MNGTVFQSYLPLPTAYQHQLKRDGELLLADALRFLKGDLLRHRLSCIGKTSDLLAESLRTFPDKPLEAVLTTMMRVRRLSIYDDQELTSGQSVHFGFSPAHSGFTEAVDLDIYGTYKKVSFQLNPDTFDVEAEACYLEPNIGLRRSKHVAVEPENPIVDVASDIPRTVLTQMFEDDSEAYQRVSQEFIQVGYTVDPLDSRYGEVPIFDSQGSQFVLADPLLRAPGSPIMYSCVSEIGTYHKFHRISDLLTDVDSGEGKMVAANLSDFFS